jgi:hypothetical protein
MIAKRISKFQREHDRAYKPQACTALEDRIEIVWRTCEVTPA